jgi:type II secretory pathway predicted ATPase ExeA
MSSLIKEKFALDRFERKKLAFYSKNGWQFMPFAQKDSLPDPHLLVPHQVEDVQKLIDAVLEGDLVSFVVSDIGMGKTALCRFLADVLPAEAERKAVTVFLQGSSIETPEQMIRSILTKLELEPKGDLASEFEQLYRWHDMYPDLLLVLIVDEFPDIGAEALDVVRALADLRGVVWIFNGQKDRLLKFLEQNSPALLQRRRLILELKPMEIDELQELLELRMAWARGSNFEGQNIEPFTREAIAEIHRRSRGIPREALKIAGDAVYVAVKDGSSKITDQTMRKFVRVRRKTTKKPIPQKKFLGFLRRRR